MAGYSLEDAKKERSGLSARSGDVALGCDQEEYIPSRMQNYLKFYYHKAYFYAFYLFTVFFLVFYPFFGVLEWQNH